MNLIITGILALIALSAFSSLFVMAEYSLVASRRTRLTEMAAMGRPGARIVLTAQADIERFLAGVQIGITVLSIAIGILAEPYISGGIRQGLTSVSQDIPVGVIEIAGGALGLLTATYLNIVLGEMIPRAIALRAVEAVACIVVPPLYAVNQLLRPFIWLLNASTRFILRRFGIGMSSHASRLYSASELEMLVEESQRGGTLESGAGDMISKVFSFGDLLAREVMVPRTEMICVDVESSLHEVAHAVATHPYDRFPVFEGSIDRIIGILHAKDMIRALLPNTRPVTPRQLMREPFFVPDSQRADELLIQLRGRHEYLAVVLDEYGGTAGLVTLNDLVSRIVGELSDNAESTPDIQPHADGSAMLNGLTTIGDVNEAFGLILQDANYDTIGGYVMGQLGRVAQLGDIVNPPGASVSFKVEEMDKLRVSRVKLIRN
jgi:CBS domain containing-hemolysin-like protein